MVNLYNSFVVENTYVSNLECLYIMQNTIVRIIAGISPKEHTAPFFVKFKILRLHQVVDYNIGVFMYKVFYKDVLKIFNDYFLPNDEIHDRNTHQKNNINPDVVNPTDEIWPSYTKTLKYGTS